MTKYHERLAKDYANLTGGMKKVALHLMEHPRSFAFQSAAQIGEEIGVSETTVIRFCRALGYTGFSELQKEVQDDLLRVESSLQNYQKGKKRGSNIPLYEQVMLRDRENIGTTANRINVRSYRQAVDKISEADRILVAGTRTSYAMAHWFSFMLNVIRGNTRLWRPETDDIILELSQINEKSLFIACSFHRYAIDTIHLTEAVKKRGAFVIALTDSAIAPVSRYADVLFTIELADSNRSTIDAAIPAFSLINALLAGVSLKEPQRFASRLDRYEMFGSEPFFIAKEVPNNEDHVE